MKNLKDSMNMDAKSGRELKNMEMTREEAINKLNWALDNNTIEDVQSAYEYIMALKIAIKALEQEPTTKNNLGVASELEKNSKKLEKDFGELDCISRQAVLEQAYAYGNGLEPDGYCVNVEDIQALPSVTPQEPRWIPVSEKLPEPFTFVNATCRSLVDDRENWVIETIYLPIPKEVNKHGYSDWGNIPMLNQGEAEVIAWVERIIPQPYKVEIEPQESGDKE